MKTYVTVLMLGVVTGATLGGLATKWRINSQLYEQSQKLVAESIQYKQNAIALDVKSTSQIREAQNESDRIISDIESGAIRLRGESAIESRCDTTTGLDDAKRQADTHRRNAENLRAELEELRATAAAQMRIAKRGDEAIIKHNALVDYVDHILLPMCARIKAGAYQH